VDGSGGDAQSPSALGAVHAGCRDRHRRGDPADLDRRGHATLHDVGVHAVRDQRDAGRPREDRDDGHARGPGRNHAQAHHRRRRGPRPGARRGERGADGDRPGPGRGKRQGPQRLRLRRDGGGPGGLGLRGRPGLVPASGRSATRLHGGGAGTQAQAGTLRRAERPGRVRARRGLPPACDRSHGPQGTHPRPRHRRLDLRPRRDRHADVQPRRADGGRSALLPPGNDGSGGRGSPRAVDQAALRKGGLHHHHADGHAGGVRQRDGRRHHGSRRPRGDLSAGRRDRHPHDDVDRGE